MFPARALPALEPLASTPGYAVRLHAAAPDRAGQFEEVQVSARASVPLGLKGGCGKKKTSLNFVMQTLPSAPE